MQMTDEIRAAYHDEIEQQGLGWIRGFSVHNLKFDECCPDFSCCMPQLFEQNRLRRIEIHNEWAARHNRPLYRDDS